MTVADAAGAPAPLMPLIWIGGERFAPGGPHLSALDRGFTLADGVFETMRAYRGVIFRRDAHLDRLHRATTALGIALPPGIAATLEAAMIAAVAAGVEDASVRLTVSRGVGAPGVLPPPDARPTVVVAVHAAPTFPAATYEPGLAVRIASGRRNEHAMTAGLKTLAYTDSVMALAEARATGADDALVLDTAGHLSEGTSSNVFVVVAGNVLVTPPRSCGALPGITRAAVIELAGELGLSLEERPITHVEIHSARELFLTSSLRGIAPVAQVDGRPVGDGTPGPTTRGVIAAYAALVRREVGG
ncbi:MAG: aminotransferase class IV [Gemmatimonadaceae bacterium]